MAACCFFTGKTSINLFNRIFAIYKYCDMAINKKSDFSAVDQSLAAFAKALSHPARIAILKVLAERNECILRSDRGCVAAGSVYRIATPERTQVGRIDFRHHRWAKELLLYQQGGNGNHPARIQFIVCQIGFRQAGILLLKMKLITHT